MVWCGVGGRCWYRRGGDVVGDGCGKGLVVEMVSKER